MWNIQNNSKRVCQLMFRPVEAIKKCTNISNSRENNFLLGLEVETFMSVEQSFEAIKKLSQNVVDCTRLYVKLNLITKEFIKF